MEKLREKTYRLAHNNATEAAKRAVEACGPENTMALNCGFGWVVIRPATHPFVRWLKANSVGHKHWKSGWEIWNPGEFGGQQIDHKYAGAKAYAEVIEKLVPGINIFADSRLD